MRQLATQMSGLRRDFGTDLRTMAATLGRATTPTRDDTVRYLYGEPLDHAPGTGAQLYSNSAVVTLTSVIEQAAGQSLVDYLTGTVLAPLGITDVFVAATPVGARRPGEVPTYDCPVVGDSLLDLSPGAVEATAYGGQFVLEIGEGAGGLLTSTGTVARTIGSPRRLGHRPAPAGHPPRRLRRHLRRRLVAGRRPRLRLRLQPPRARRRPRQHHASDPRRAQPRRAPASDPGRS